MSSAAMFSTHHPFQGLIDPFTLAVLGRNISLWCILSSVLIPGLVMVSFTSTILRQFIMCTHQSHLRWLEPFVYAVPITDFPCIAELLAFIGSIGVMVFVQGAFVWTSVQILLNVSRYYYQYTDNVLPFILTDNHLLRIGVGMILFVPHNTDQPRIWSAFNWLIALFDVEPFVVNGERPEREVAVEVYTRVVLLCGALSCIVIATLTTIGVSVVTAYNCMCLLYARRTYNAARKPTSDLPNVASQSENVACIGLILIMIVVFGCLKGGEVVAIIRMFAELFLVLKRWVRLVGVSGLVRRVALTLRLYRTAASFRLGVERQISIWTECLEYVVVEKIQFKVNKEDSRDYDTLSSILRPYIQDHGAQATFHSYYVVNADLLHKIEAALPMTPRQVVSRVALCMLYTIGIIELIDTVEELFHSTNKKCAIRYFDELHRKGIVIHDAPTNTQ